MRSIFFTLINSFAIVVNAQNNYDNHILFDNSLTASSYYYSEGSSTSPSYVELNAGKFPVEEKIFFTPPNSLKLKWMSKSDGDWKISLNISTWRNREIIFSGDTLSFWCYSDEQLQLEELPFISLVDLNGINSSSIELSEVISEVPISKWFRIKIPLISFSKRNKEIDFKKITMINFSQALDDSKEHIIYLDEFKIDNNNSADKNPSVVPKKLIAKGYDKHIDLIWEPNSEEDLQGYIIYRSFDGKDFKPVGIQKKDFNRYSDFIGTQEVKVFHKITAYDADYNESEKSNLAEAKTYKMQDDELLSMVQEACFRYYWEAAHPVAGLSLENIPGDENLIAIGASGFGIMGIIVGIERGFISRDEGTSQLLKIAHFLKNADRFHGAFPHFMDGRIGKVIPLFGKYDNGGDLVETAFLMQGLLVARQYFNKDNDTEKEIVKNITDLWEAVEWDWYRKDPDNDFLFWHWSPEYEWHINHPLIGWNETMIVYLLAIASPTHPVPAEMYFTGWGGQSERAIRYRQNWGQTTEGDHYRNGNIYYGIKLDVAVGNGGPLFFTHYSFMGFDPRGIKDKFTNYFNNNKNIALINHFYCIKNPGNYKGYSDSCWGLTASDNPWGYQAHDPTLKNDNGTITPTGALSSFPYTPGESMKALKYFYNELGNKLWDIYGFRDAFNLSENWFANIYLGLNQAPIAVMIENYRSGLIWKLFMSNKEIKPMLDAIGFKEDN